MKMIRAIAISLFLLFSFQASAFAEELRVTAKDHQAEYERVWSAAIDTLYEMGFPISFMSKGDGYLVTERKVFNMEVRKWMASGYRVGIALRLVSKDGFIIVVIRSDAEEMSWDRSSPYTEKYAPFYLWKPVGRDAKLEKSVKEGISSRL